jgi:hypothetical protein
MHSIKFDKYVFLVLCIFALGAVAETLMTSYIKKMNYDTYNQIEDEYDFLEDDFFEEFEELDIDDKQQTSPQGYEWVNCEQMTAQFLKPDDWYFLEESNQDSTACFLTQQKITEEAPYFTTGLSINAVQNATQQLPLPPEQFISSLLDEVSTAFDEVSPQSTLQEEGSPLYGKASTMSTPEFTVYYLHYWNQETDTVYLLSFESPTSEWEEAWNTATPIFETLGINRKY